MHFEICADQAAVARVAARIRGVKTPAPAAKPAGPRLMFLTPKPYMSGADIERVQVRLNRDYSLYSDLVEDGVFGPATDKTVRAFQRRARLKVDGVVGPATLKGLGL